MEGRSPCLYWEDGSRHGGKEGEGFPLCFGDEESAALGDWLRLSLWVDDDAIDRNREGWR